MRPKSWMRPRPTAEDKRLAEVLKDPNVSDEEKDAIVREGVQTVQDNWTEEQERKAAGRSAEPYELPLIQLERWDERPRRLAD